VLVRQGKALDAVGDIGRCIFGSGKEAAVLLFVGIGLFGCAVNAIRTVCAVDAIDAVAFLNIVMAVCCWQNRTGAVERLVNVLNL
jgi:hypothetical protein